MRRALDRYLRTQAGDTYNADAVNKTVEDATIGLAKNGEPFAAVLVRSERVPPSAAPASRGDRRIINLVYAVEPGKRVYVERIDIHGDTKTRDAVIRREFDFGEGDGYNRALVERAERRLKALGYFKIGQDPAQPGSAPDRIVVDVTVEEDQTGNFYISGGYSTAGGALASVTVGDANFLGTGDIARVSVTYGQYVRGFDLSFTDPYALGPRLSLGVDLFGKENARRRLSVVRQHRVRRQSLARRAVDRRTRDAVELFDLQSECSLDPAVGPSSLPIVQAAQAGPMWVSSVGTGITYSTLDNPRNPTSGVRVQTNNEFAGLGGAAKFARTTEDARYYHEIFGDVVGMARVQTGYATPWGGQPLPLLNGFFGGPQLVRGFAPNGFGPRDVTPGTTQDNVGGNVYWTTTAELQTPMPLVSADAKLKVALFADAGSLWATRASSAASLASSLSPSQQIANSRAIRASVGAGLIWDSPFGALRVDYAYPVAKQNYDVTQRLNFSAGMF